MEKVETPIEFIFPVTFPVRFPEKLDAVTIPLELIFPVEPSKEIPSETNGSEPINKS